jgi:prepilin-type processing-associated H-X9-DG protein
VIIKKFTSTDALVIIFVTGLLAAIIAPSVGTARDKARQKGCTGNMKHIGTSMIMYFSDGSETHFPHSSSPYLQTYSSDPANDSGDIWKFLDGALSCMAKRNNGTEPDAKVYSYCKDIAGAPFKFIEDPQSRVATESYIQDSEASADFHKTGGKANILAGDGHVESGTSGFEQNPDRL